MKFYVIFGISILTLLACKTQKELPNKQNANQTSETPSDISYRQVYNPQNQNLEGVWKLVGTDQFSVLSNDDSQNTEVADITWKFITDDRGSVLYTSQLIEGNKPLSDNSYQYWFDGCLLQINNKAYAYEIYEIKNQNGETVGKDLTVHENTDPSLADAGVTYRFRSMDTFWACATDGDTITTRPQLVSLINGIVMQAYVPESNIIGNWKLVSLSAFTSPSNLPNYRDNEIVWHFGKMNEVTVKKSSSDIKNDYSHKEGKHQYWVNNCIIKVGGQTYQYILDQSGKTETLTLIDGIHPGIADHSKYIFKRI